MTRPRLKIAADIGGTFTDIAVFLADGRLATRKVPSTPGDYSRGVIDGIRELAAAAGLAMGDFGEVLHGCTVATNAILELKGARTALLTTAGFRDVLELRRIRVPRLYDARYVKPAPLAPRDLRFEVRERIAADGSVVAPLDEGDVASAIAAIRRAGAEAVAVCFLHSYANPAHERRVGEMLRAALPGVFVSLSIDVLPEIREYERTSTTVINAYVGPPVASYIRSLRDGLRGAGLDGQLLVMQSSGGILDAESVMEMPARIVECGPAAGVISAAHAAARCGHRNVITFDMGGTTAKASLIEDGQISRTDEYEVGSGISLSSRLMKGGGYALKLPVIDISEVGAGGGSIVRLDRAGMVKVGPDSAGAVPGPACYGMGGTAPTVSDANVVLGFLNPVALADGAVPIRAELSHAALADRVARPMGIAIDEAAWSVFVVAAANMVRAVKAVSTYRGRNPSDFVLMAFGGNGGVFAAELLRQLQIRRALVPAAAGVFSAVGLCVGDVQFSQSRAFLRRLDGIDVAAARQVLDDLAREVTARIEAQRDAVTLRRSAAMRYVGQAFELPVVLDANAVDAATLAALGPRFQAEHERTYGLRLDFPVEIVSLEVSATLAASTQAPSRTAATAIAKRNAVARDCYFGPGHGRVVTPILRREALDDTPRRGPLVIEDYEGTTVVPPDALAWRDTHDNIVIELRETGS
ncbi:MAG: hydantoinase/oxoprolinase family protein [Alphaproteobacteria bacterium]|nr:hydantoinase/oxoprolinase family protein [Alphaproteobacteria bacterium]